ncbi:MAG: hypothetical protein KC776_27740 [Myxococcales bacterium]|nr:hypothetical protein [Myxococcales bacterium]MCB9577644.1 hypothetical protein [Polyangiaceae bacterium]
MNRGWALALLLLWGGCGDGETTLSPLDAGGDASLDGGLPDAAQDASPPKVRRTVMQRNPFGNVAATQNLLWDGDFEWSSPFSGQYGWVDAVYFSPTGNFSQIRVGPMCRSGLKCGYMTQSQRVAAIGVSPSGTKVSASVWVKVPTNDCGDMGVHLFACDFAKDPDLPMSDPDGPDADGWCHYQAVGAERTSATCLFLQAHFIEGEAVVDDAVVQAAPADAPETIAKVAPADARALDEARNGLRKWLSPGAHPPPAARQALDAWMRRARR